MLTTYIIMKEKRPEGERSLAKKLDFFLNSWYPGIKK